ncbi:alpha/beta hydrolase family protein [Bounagaea algeriensis]
MHAPEQGTRVVELRVHGVLGATGPKLTDSVEAVDVAGDGVGRVVRPADRLRRPVPGPALRDGSRTVPRIVEGYVWGSMTSGGPGKALWALLFPFALANLARWMLPPVRPESRTGRVVGHCARALVRVAAIALTMLFVAQLTVVTADLLAAQCLRPGSGCLGPVPDAAREFDLLRIWLGLVPVGLVVLLMQRLAGKSWPVTTGNSANARQGAPRPSARAPVLPGGNVVTDPETPALRALHIGAALSTVALLLLGGPFAAQGDPRWIASAAVLVCCVFGAAALDDPEEMWAQQPRRRVLFGRVPRRALQALAAALVLAAAVAPAGTDGPLPGSGPTIDALTALLGLTCLLTGLVLVPAALLAAPLWKPLPRRMRPWAGGWFAAPLLFLAAMLGTGFGAGLALSLRHALGAEGLVLPRPYQDVTTFWGVAAVLLGAAALVGVPWLLLWRWRCVLSGESVPPEVGLLHAGRYRDRQAAASAWLWARVQRSHGYLLLLVLAGVLLVAATAAAGLRLAGLGQVAWAGWFAGLGVVTLAGLAVGLLRMVFVAATERHAARYLGVLCDLTLFWPRESHPVVPPCYSLKVIPELVARAQEHLSDPNTRVVLVGHSQGSLLVTVAVSRLLASLPPADRERIGLVTAGSQLQWAYPRAFPAAVSHDAIGELADSLGGRWRALCRGTDPMGGAVTTWSRHVYAGTLLGVGHRPGSTCGPLPPATRGPTGALVLGGDHWLPDPQRGPVSHRRWVPGVLRHTDYAGDPEWDRAVAMAAGLEPGDAEAGPALPESVLGSTGPGPRGDAGPRGDTGSRGETGRGPQRRWPVAVRGGDGAAAQHGPRSTRADEQPAGTATAASTVAEAETAQAGTGGAVDAVPQLEHAAEEVGAQRSVHDPALQEEPAAEAEASVEASVEASAQPGAPATGEPEPAPEVFEPAGRTAPWERAQGLHPLE